MSSSGIWGSGGAAPAAVGDLRRPLDRRDLFALGRLLYGPAEDSSAPGSSPSSGAQVSARPRSGPTPACSSPSWSRRPSGWRSCAAGARASARRRGWSRASSSRRSPRLHHFGAGLALLQAGAAVLLPAASPGARGRRSSLSPSSSSATRRGSAIWRCRGGMPIPGR